MSGINHAESKPQRQDVDTRPLGPDDLKVAESILISSFHDRPFYRYIAPDESERQEFLKVNFRLRLEHGLETSEMEFALLDTRIVGIAVWSPPPIAPLDEDHSLEEAFARFSPGLQQRFFAFLTTLFSARDQVVQQPYWSLAPIAILPEEQGKGIASALIRKKLRQIDASRAPCFLGTQDKPNLAIYARYGFQVMREDPLAPGIVHYTMLREAAQP
jgi:predicted GNAT family N-acyltransferase